MKDFAGKEIYTGDLVVYVCNNQLTYGKVVGTDDIRIHIRGVNWCNWVNKHPYPKKQRYRLSAQHPQYILVINKGQVPSKEVLSVLEGIEK